MWHFDRSLEHIDKALYYGAETMGANWVTEIVEKNGASVIGRIKSLLVDETS